MPSSPRTLCTTRSLSQSRGGREQIIERWLERKDEPGQTTFARQRLVDIPERAVIVGTATCLEPRRVYNSNLWVIRLDHEGRCREFTEWWMEHPADQTSDGT